MNPSVVEVGNEPIQRGADGRLIDAVGERRLHGVIITGAVSGALF
jgi:hypothetical protein